MKARRNVNPALFPLVEELCWRYAEQFGLRLTKVRTLNRREVKSAQGKCSVEGVLGFDLLGQRAWQVLDLIAHELAHLAFFDHKMNWMRLYSQLVQKMLDDGVLDKLEPVCEPDEI